MALVPDDDVAGDLFMEARNEADLIRRAERWRAQQGLPAIGGRPALPSLSAAQRVHAAHLTRRARVRRQLKQGFGLIAVALLAAVLALWQRPARDGGPALELDSTYEGAAVAIRDQSTGLEVLVYRAEAMPGAVTLWWAVTGPDAGTKAEQLTPEVALSADATDWRAPQRSEIKVHRRNRVLGKSTYALFAPVRFEAAFLRMREGETVKADWSLAVPLERSDTDPAARTVAVDREATFGSYAFRLLNLTRGPNHTGVRYLAEFMESNAFLTLETEGALLLPSGNWQAQDLSPAEIETVLPPLPPGSKRLTALFSPRGWRLEEASLPLFVDTRAADWSVTEWKLEGGAMEAVLTASPQLLLADGAVRQNGVSLGQRRIQIEYLGSEPDGDRRWRLTDPEFMESGIPGLELSLRFTRLFTPILRLDLELDELK